MDVLVSTLKSCLYPGLLIRGSLLRVPSELIVGIGSTLILVFQGDTRSSNAALQPVQRLHRKDLLPQGDSSVPDLKPRRNQSACPVFQRSRSRISKDSVIKYTCCARHADSEGRLRICKDAELFRSPATWNGMSRGSAGCSAPTLLDISIHIFLNIAARSNSE